VQKIQSTVESSFSESELLNNLAKGFDIIVLMANTVASVVI
jgi:hypothetical protein